MKKILLLILILLLSSSIYANVDETVGNIRLVIENYTGTVALYRKGADGKFTSMFDSKTFTSSPAFYVFYDGAELPVSNSGGFKLKSTFKDTNATVHATLKNKLEIVINFELFSANEENIVDAVKITASIENLSKRSHEVAIKAFFDTWLGENTTTHFTTSLRSKITSETNFTNIINEKWIQSANTTDVIRFIIPDETVPSIDSITVANKYLLSQLNWRYNIEQGKEFHSLNSYNNSALTITWNNFILDDQLYDEVELYILTGEPSVQIPSVWPPAQANVAPTTTIREETPAMNLSAADLQKIREIVATIEVLKNDNTYLSDQEIILLNAEIDEILQNAGR